ncbi:bifunctional metallophosphatase/5'-nucleotidase [Microbacterium gallinarum]|uniref:Bifunctional metallophosphatase/5'-nucleotidase n=1 Tax=Microbacterium gallinarum TaxID=2762209 RepID=A0ABR8X4C8_9MICO|nr:bifunctional UDP-sugar hydrolase/5'-nucleotidase [Microbacterium gallinarum]MBD8023982.1 bifunctional metallophosphatase/5'-nucleotidase [Microbacterium gallinarum]
MRIRSHQDRSVPRRRALALAATVATLALTATGVASASAAPKAPDTPKGKANGTSVEINLVTVNDFHGRIEQSGTAAGIARLATAVKQIRAENPNTVFAAAGDMIGASTFTSFIQDDVPTIETLNAAGLDVSAVGNHEFDQGFADLTDRVMPLADWEYLGANVYDKESGDPALPEYWIAKFQGVRVGFVGAVTDELPSLVSPSGIEDITVGSPVDAANRVADQLSDGRSNNGEADIVVMLVHEGAATTSIESATDPDSRFGHIVLNANDNIDAIVSGHTHLPYNHVIDGRPVISSGQYGERFSNMEITYDRKSKSITSMENTLYTMATEVNSSGAVTAWLTEPDPAIVPLVTEATAVANELGSVEIGDTAGALNRAQRPGVVNGQPALVENRGGESTLGNFVADVQLWALNEDGTRSVDITFMNPGGLRADINAGETTYREAADVQSFANTLVTLDMTGAQIKAVLEEQWQPAGASRPFLKLGVNEALSYTYDPTAPQGSHIVDIFLAGEPLEPGEIYSVGANSFLASGGDNFVSFRLGTNKADSGKVDLEAMVDYFTEFGGAAPDYAQRAVGVDVVSVVGDQATINLSSLDFSTTEPKAGSVTVSFDGAPLATATVDPSFPDPSTFDEIGRATVTFTIPAGATGDSEFVITTPTGTEARFTLGAAL